MDSYRNEIFGPVLEVMRVDTYADAVKLVNDNPYGNGTAIFTRDGGAARQFQFEVEAGMVGINVPIPVPVAYYSFGGWKALAVRRPPHVRPRGHPVLHPRQGRHVALAGPRHERRSTWASRAPAESLAARGRVTPARLIPTGQSATASPPTAGDSQVTPVHRQDRAGGSGHAPDGGLLRRGFLAGAEVSAI